MKPPIRLSAIMEIPCVWIFTHDSIGVGEDGMTHQPIEHLAALRSIPGLLTFRPGDANETLEMWKYILPEVAGPVELILLASGSEVSLMLEAYEQLAAEGVKVRAVSVPCMELFMRQSVEYKESVLPDACRARVSIEAAEGISWHRLIGLDGAHVGMETFGASAPLKDLLSEFGFTAPQIVGTAKKVLKACANGRRPLN